MKSVKETVKESVLRIIAESFCDEEVWVRVEGEYGDLGINILLEMGYPEP